MTIVAKNIYILTGTMGSGKSTVIEELKKQGVKTISEPARDILKEQRLINGKGLPEKEPELFTHLLLSRTLSQYKENEQSKSLVISDRGLPDIIGYAKLFNLEPSVFINAAKKLRYNPKVFILPSWNEIYENDDERKMPFEQAQEFSNHLYDIYGSIGYELIEVPKICPQERAGFILNNI